MKLSKLLAARHDLMRQVQLANLAHHYATLQRLADRIAQARLTGRVRLRAITAEESPQPATLTALTGSQAVIEEFFSDQDVLELADAIEFACSEPFQEIEFDLPQLEALYARPLRQTLRLAGVELDGLPTVPPFSATSDNQRSNRH